MRPETALDVNSAVQNTIHKGKDRVTADIASTAKPCVSGGVGHRSLAVCAYELRMLTAAPATVSIFEHETQKNSRGTKHKASSSNTEYCNSASQLS